MSRRRRAVSRAIAPDPIYGSVLVEKFINKLMLHGKKSLARRMFYDAVEKFSERVHADNPLEAFEQVIENAKPLVEVRSRRVGGSTYQVPVEIPAIRQLSLAMRWIITHARAKPGKSTPEALALEFADCYNKQGTTIKKKEDTHRMAEANKAFAHYRW